MPAKAKVVPPLPRWYRGADVPMRVIRQYACAVAERFEPEKIILFGSYAYGTPHDDSDVDILVVMSCRNQHDQAVKIRLEIPRNFAMDVLVRTPKNLFGRLEEGESFHSDIVNRGVVLYEKKRTRVDPLRRSRPKGSSASRKQSERA